VGAASISMNKNWLRYVSLLLFLALQCFLLLGILLATRVNTDSVLRGHTEEIMLHVVNSVSSRTKALLEPAESSVLLSHTLLQTGQIDAFDDVGLEKYFISQLETYNQYAGMYLGRSDGSFVFVKRDTGFTSPEGLTSTYRTKIIQTKPQRTVELIFQDAKGSILSREFDLEDNYDPRTRPWYIEAREYIEARAQTQVQDITHDIVAHTNRSTIWTKPYIFFSSMKPGITAASYVQSSAGVDIGTVGIDIELSDLSHYLEVIASDEKDSFAFLQTTDDILVAFPEFDRYLENKEPRVLPQISDIKNTKSETFLIASEFQNSIDPSSLLVDFEVDRVPYIGTLQPISVIEGQHWLLGIHGPKKSYTGNIMDRYQQSMWQILALGLLCSLIAIPLSFGISRPLQRLHKQATTDSLTGLYDRSQFIRQAKRLEAKAKRTKKRLAYVMIDLDNFKPINDIYGHSIGDEVLVIVAKRLQDAIKTNDVVARFGGDEFAICLYDIDPHNIRATVERIRKTIEGEGIRSTQGFHQVGVTAGVFLSQIDVIPETSLALADSALVQGKVTKKGRSYLADGNINQSKIIQNRIDTHHDAQQHSTLTSENVGVSFFK